MVENFYTSLYEVHGTKWFQRHSTVREIPADDLLAGLELATVRVLDDFSKRKLKGNTRQTFEDSVKATLQYWPGDIAEETEPRHMTDDTAKGTSGGGESSPGGALHL